MVTLFDAILWLLALIIVGSIYWYMSIPKNLPPGPFGFPMIGSSLDYRDGGNQHKALLKHAKQYGPLFKLYIADKLIVVLGDFDTIHEALVKQGDVFVGRPQVFGFMPEKYKRHGIVFSEGDLWKEQRRFALSTLRDFGVGRPILEPRIMEEIEYLNEHIADYASSKKSFDPQNPLTSAVSNIINVLIFGRRFDYDDKEFVEQFSSLSKRTSGNGVGWLSPFILSDLIRLMTRFMPVVHKMKKESLSFIEFTKREMEKTKSTYDPDAEPTNYIHAFMKAATDRTDGYFTDVQLIMSVTDLFSAGTETTSTSLRWAILFLAQHPDVQEKLYEEIKEKVGVSSLPLYSDRPKLPFAEAVVMETQRLGNLLPVGVMRRSLEPTKLMGYDIPENTIVVPLLISVMQNPDLYPNPDKFDPYRFLDDDGKVIRDQKFIPFQIGKRVCLGEPLARMELFLFLTGLVSKYRFYFPEDRPKPTMEPVGGFTLTPTRYEICVETRD